MVDVCGRAQPELRAVLPAGVHHGEVVDARHQDHALLVLAQLGDAADQEQDLKIIPSA